MSVFIGGSAHAMAQQLAEGFILISAASLRKYQPADLRALETELEKLAREVRGEQPPIDDTQAIQRKNRKLGRLNQAALIIRNYQMQRH